MAKRIRARNVDEAIAVASQLKARGDYDRFRGQLQDWPLCPSALRIDEAQRSVTLEKLGRFEHWIRSTQGLDSLLAPDAFFAVAQHYGIPTNYIDFTTNAQIAGFFASDNPQDRSLERDSCIVCLNTEDLMRFWKALPAKYPPPELIEIEVSNLWRLEAQEGCFLFCPYDEIERIYDFDRITFPYSGPLAALPRERIYPKEKSALEILLDQFMMAERLREGTAAIRSMPAMENLVVHQVQSSDVDSEVLGRDLPVHPSWSPTALQPWLSDQTERYHEAVRGQVYKLRVDQAMLLDRSPLRAQIHQILDEGPDLRNSSVRWDVIAGPPLVISAQPALADALNHLWEGVRRLPYSTEQASYAMAETIVLWHESNGGAGYAANQGQPAATRCFGDSVEIEFGATDGSYSRAYVSENMLTNAIRSDVPDYLAERWKETLLAHPASLIQVIRNPRLLFNFSRLADVVVRQVVPFQIVFRRRDVAVFFSPARLRMMGLP
jgi:hypothetical protein